MERKIVEYRRFDPIPEPVEPIFVAVDETGNVYDEHGNPWFPPEGVKLREVAIGRFHPPQSMKQWIDSRRAKPSTEPS